MKKRLVVLFLVSFCFSIKSYTQVSVTPSDDLNQNEVSVDEDAMNWELSYNFMETDMVASQDNCMGQDTTPPQISCPQNITQATSTTNCGVAVYFPTPSVSDNCPGVSVQCYPPSGTRFLNGTTTVNCTATDASNNTADCSFDVTIVDNVPPSSLYCFGDIIISNDPNMCGAVVTWPIPLGSDQCDYDSIIEQCDPPWGSTFPIGTTTVNCTATDASGNVGSCSFDVTVIHNRPDCSGNCPPTVTLNNTSVNSLYQAQNSVTAGNTTTYGVNADFKAGDVIELKNGFTARKYTNFSAEIDNCN